jgi:hypothetical protein
MSHGYTTIHQACLEQGIDLGAVSVELMGLHTTGARPFRADRWNAYSENGGGYQYQVASGDTLSGLAALYLDSAARWPEIWNLQDSRRTNPAAGYSPDRIYVDEWLEMPAEAGDNARVMNGGADLPGTAGHKVAPGEKGIEPATAAKLKKYAPYVIGGVLALGVLYAVTR